MKNIQDGQTKPEVDAKIERLVENVEGEDEYKALIRARLNEFVGYMSSLGEDMIMNMPDDVRFVFKDAKKMERKGIKALYESSDRTITLRDNASSQDKCDFIISLAHEMRHAIQDKEGLFSSDSVIPNQLFVFNKLCEIEAKLQNIIVESKILTIREGSKSAICQFYEAEIERSKQEQIKKKHGKLTKKQEEIIQLKAEERAKSKIVRLFWSGLYDDLTGDSQKTKNSIPAEVKQDVESWTEVYDRQALDEMKSILSIYDDPEQMFEAVSNPNFPKGKKDLHDFIQKHLRGSLRVRLSQLRGFGVNQQLEYNISDADFSGERTDIDSTRKKIMKYTEKIGIKLSPSYFTAVQEATSFIVPGFLTKSSREFEIERAFSLEGRKGFPHREDGSIAPGFIIRYYPNNGTRKSELFSLGDRQGFVFRTYAPMDASQRTPENESTAIGKLTREVFYDAEDEKHDVETIQEKGTTKYIFLPWNHGEKNGFELKIDERGVVISKTLYKDDQFVRTEVPTEEEKKEKSFAEAMQYAKELHKKFMTDGPEKKSDGHAMSRLPSHGKGGR